MRPGTHMPAAGFPGVTNRVWVRVRREPSEVILHLRVDDVGVEVGVLTVELHDTSLVAIDPNCSEER